MLIDILLWFAEFDLALAELGKNPVTIARERERVQYWRREQDLQILKRSGV